MANVHAIVTRQGAEVSLNGAWEKGGEVPLYAGNRENFQVYERKVKVPADWTDKLIRVDFEAVNYIADVYVNGKHLSNHVGPWLPFSVDVTNEAKPGDEFVLKVEVKGMMNAPIIDETKKLALWPVGVSKLGNKLAGIVGDVWLRAYGKTYIQDVFIQPSVENKKLVVDYTINNTESTPKTFDVFTQVSKQGDSKIAHHASLEKVILQPGETKTVRLQSTWENPDLWWPDRPELYILTSQLKVEGKMIDEEKRRFGFREIKIFRDQFQLNGVRINLWGDYAVYAEKEYWPMEAYTPENIHDTMKKLKDLNVRIMRWHERPSPRYTLEAADEMGILLVCESAVEHLDTIVKDEFVKNSREWVKAWVRENRNHPSIFMWSADNAMGKHCFKVLSDEELLSIGNAIHEVDPTRPVTYDGDQDVGDQVVNWHGGKPVGSIYSWAERKHPNKPTGVSEHISTLVWWKYTPEVVEQHKWWHGIWIRGMRYVGLTDIRPAVFHWASQEMTSERAQVLRNGYASVALFDKDYDDLGIEPFTQKKYPRLTAGSSRQGTLVIYNDEFRDTVIQLEVTVSSGNMTYASGVKEIDLTLGEHLDLPYSFQVPFAKGELSVRLKAKKNGVVRFDEVKKFEVSDFETARETSREVTFK